MSIESTNNEKNLKRLFSKKEWSVEDIKQAGKCILEIGTSYYGLNTEIKPLSFLDAIKENKSKGVLGFLKIISFVKKSAYFSALEKTEGAIVLNANKIKKRLDSKNEYFSKYSFTKTCFHELTHALQDLDTKNSKVDDEPLSILEYIKFREKFILKYDNNYYHNNHERFYKEIEANLDGASIAIDFLHKYERKIFEKVQAKADVDIYYSLNKENMYDMSDLNIGCQSAVKKLLKKDPEALKNSSSNLLRLEFDKYGNKKTPLEVIRMDREKNDITDDLYYKLIINSIDDRINFNDYLKTFTHSSDVKRMERAVIFGINELEQKRLNNEKYYNDEKITKNVYQNNYKILVDKYKYLKGYQKLLIEEKNKQIFFTINENDKNKTFNDIKHPVLNKSPKKELLFEERKSRSR
ncbi:MAG: hypothetical protein PHQ89_00525 [Bacilli bacterium]|nr:hypothetical protein [Bacilli bacterium]